MNEEVVNLLQASNRKHICLFELIRKVQKVVCEEEYLTRDELFTMLITPAYKIMSVQDPSNELVRSIFTKKNAKTSSPSLGGKTRVSFRKSTNVSQGKFGDATIESATIISDKTTHS